VRQQLGGGVRYLGRLEADVDDGVGVLPPGLGLRPVSVDVTSVAGG